MKHDADRIWLHHSMARRLAECSLIELLEWLHETHATAMVRLGEGFDGAVLFFTGGELYRAEWGSLAGENAVARLLLLRDAPFRVVMRIPYGAQPNLVTPTEDLIKQCRAILSRGDARAA